MFEKALDHKPVEVSAPAQNPSDYFGVMVFGRAQMRKYLNKQIYTALLDTIENTNFTVMAYQRHVNRIKVILVGTELGY